MNTHNGQTILILGGTGGIGSCIADFLEQKGARVIRHGTIGPYAFDVRTKKDVDVFVDNIIHTFGKIDAIVNSLSAPITIGSFDKKTWENFSEHLNVQLKAAVEIEGRIISLMKKQGQGRIIHILTSYVIGAPPSSIAEYITAKYAMLGLTKALAKELGRFHITVNAVSPGFIKNKFSSGVPEKLPELISAETPLGTLTSEEDVARAVSFLLSDGADHITGENINLSGGHVME